MDTDRMLLPQNGSSPGSQNGSGSSGGPGPASVGNGPLGGGGPMGQPTAHQPHYINSMARKKKTERAVPPLQHSDDLLIQSGVSPQ